MLLITMNVIIILAAMAAAFLSIAFQDSLEHRSAQDRLKAFYLAEAGVSDAVASLREGRSGSIGTRTEPFSFDGGSYWTTAEETTPGTWRVVSEGRYGSEARAIEVVVGDETDATAFYTGAGFGDVSVEVGDTATTDSYDSSQGSWLSQATNDRGGTPFANTNGHVESNGDIALDAGSMVFGDAVSGVGNLLGMVLAYVEGSTASRTEDKSLPAVTVPPEITAIAPTTLVVSSAQTLATGEYHFDELRVKPDEELTITGPATIVADFIDVEGGSILVDDTDGPVIFYATGKVDIRKSASVRSMDNEPWDVIFFVATDNYTGYEGSTDGDGSKAIKIREDATFRGVLFAPNAVVKVYDRARVFGTVFGKKLRLLNDAAIHYDERLRDLPSSKVGAGKAKKWNPGGGRDRDPGELSIRTWRVVGVTPES